MIVSEVVSFDLRLIQTEQRGELTFDRVIGSRQAPRPRLGMAKLTALELLNKLLKCYGVKMLETFKEADLYSTLLNYYEVFPYNDIALKLVTNIFARSINHQAAKLAEQQEAKVLESKKRGPAMSWAQESADTEEPAEQPVEDEGEDDQQKRDAVLIYLLFETKLIEKIMELC